MPSNTRRDIQSECLLRYFDEDGDGKVSPSELRHMLSMMQGGVLDGDGFGGFDLMEAGGEEEKLKDLRDAFEMYGTKRCGFITFKSLKEMLKRLGESKYIDDCKVMINQFDLNVVGMLSFE